MDNFTTASPAAERIGSTVEDVVLTVYRNPALRSRCPLVSGRRLIPIDALDEIAGIIAKRKAKRSA